MKYILAVLVLIGTSLGQSGPSVDYAPAMQPVVSSTGTGPFYPLTTTGTFGPSYDYAPTYLMLGYNSTTNKYYVCGAANPCTGAGGSGSSGVSSFNGRTGAVTPATGDYNFSAISGRATAAQLPVSGTQALAGKNCFIYGDSYSATYGSSWQPTLAALTGCTITGQRALSGRPTQGIFNDYTASGNQTNIFKASTITTVSYIDSTNGTVNTATTGYTQYGVSDFMNVQPNQTIVANQSIAAIQNVGVAFYNASKTYISGVGNSTQTSWTTPAGAYYMRTTIVSANASSLMVSLNTTPATYTPYSNPPDYGAGGTNNYVTAIAADLTNVDAVFIELGTNDGQNINSTSLGNPGDSAGTASEYGYILNALTQIQQANASVRIFWIGQIQFNPANYSPSSGTITPAQMIQLVTAQKYVCASRGVPYIDLNSISGVNADTWSTYLRDGVHFTDAAFAGLYAPQIARELNRYAVMF